MAEERGGGGSLRDHLANERTFLAWMRTSVALVALGFVVARFGILLREIAGGHAHVFTARAGAVVGVLLVIGGASAAILATLRFLRLRRDIERGRVVPSPAIDLALGGIIALAGIVLAIYIVITT